MFRCSVVAFQVYFLQIKLSSALFLFILAACLAETDPNDVEVLNQFKKCLENPELLNWPLADDPCSPQPWPHIFCKENRVTQIQVRGLGLSGCLPPTFNKLSMLINLGLQQNRFSGPLPSFSGLSELQYAYLDFNNFTSIPSDFFSGLVSLEVMALDENSLNGTSGWSFPDDLQNSLKLRNLSCIGCNLVGPLPDFLGRIPSLSVLKLSMNRITGVIPSSFMDSGLQILWLNDQSGGGIGGTIDVVTTMVSLSSLWLHGNNFSGKIPQRVDVLTNLKDLNLNGNKLTGVIPNSLANMKLDNLDLNNNMLMGRIPEFKATKFSYQSNFFCQTMPNVSCAPQVTVLLHFLDGLGYPLRLVSSWSGNDPCQGPWLGLGCAGKSVSSIILPNYGLCGTLSPVLASLSPLVQIKLEDNNLTGQIPASWTSLKSLRLLNLSRNNFSLPLPEFSNKVKVITDGNLLLNYDRFGISPLSQTVPDTKHNSSQDPQSKPKNQSLPLSNHDSNNKDNTFKIQVVVIVPLVIIIVIIFITIPLSFYYHKKRKVKNKTPRNMVIPRQDPYEPNNLVKITIASKMNGNSSPGNDSVSGSDGRTGDSHVIEAGNLIISVQVLRNVTKNFAPENELGRGGFGIVYEGEFDDGAKIAVKRMEAGFLSSKALDEFHAEIAVLSKVRHRHLVSLLGYSVEENERILVYEYMPKGALSKHLFQWKKLTLEPLSWKRRLNIALDVARGMEYLHSLAHQSFIHRDLKSSNILIDDDYRAKVSDFGLVKLAPDGEKSLITKLAGTFGYLAPEYAVTGKITTKSDVFSFGVVVMEILTGRMALDEERPEESQYLPAWFHNIKSSKDELRAAVDQALDLKEDFSWDGFLTVAQLAGHCTCREPSQRPDMGHAVSVLSSLVDQWKPWDENHENCYGIDFTLPLNQLVNGWKEAEGIGMLMNSWLGMDDTKDSIPVRPTGFADPFSSTDGR